MAYHVLCLQPTQTIVRILPAWLSHHPSPPLPVCLTACCHPCRASPVHVCCVWCPPLSLPAPRTPPGCLSLSTRLLVSFSPSVCLPLLVYLFIACCFSPLTVCCLSLLLAQVEQQVGKGEWAAVRGASGQCGRASEQQ